MSCFIRMWVAVIFSFVLFMQGSVFAAVEQGSSEKDKKPSVSLSGDMGQAMMREAARVKKDLEQKAQSLFEREPLGWDLDTIH
ncbi:MAG: hypothetical protein JRG79_07290, partial [Deltaproteobacteria bacterium]|nr:hypothetical protein [Deltaproteobacteria bacterium]